MKTYNNILDDLQEVQRTWLITGVAGFIGAHLADALIAAKQRVIGLDNFSSGCKNNLSGVLNHPDFTLIEGDIRDQETCLKACLDVDYILHHAAIASVSKSIESPILTDQVNNGGFLNILLAAAQAQNVKKIIYASSSAIYGNKDETTQRHEGELSAPMSPYAASKCANEKYAQALSYSHGLKGVGLRYFNIYGARQDPNGAYAAVIPTWISAMLKGEKITIFGDGETTRDFCHIDDVVQANILSALSAEETGQACNVYNIASGQGTTLNTLFSILKDLTGYDRDPIYKPVRAGDIKISRANITLAEKDLGFIPRKSFVEGLAQTVQSYRDMDKR